MPGERYNITIPEPFRTQVEAAMIASNPKTTFPGFCRTLIQEALEARIARGELVGVVAPISVRKKKQPDFAKRDEAERLRVKLQIHYKDLANLLGISKARICQIFGDQPYEPNITKVLDALQKIADERNSKVPPSYTLEGRTKNRLPQFEGGPLSAPGEVPDPLSSLQERLQKRLDDALGSDMSTVLVSRVDGTVELHVTLLNDETASYVIPDGEPFGATLGTLLSKCSELIQINPF